MDRKTTTPTEQYKQHKDTVFIYGLIDPRDGRTRYVGQSVDPEKRYCAHIDSALKSKKNGPVQSWIRQLHHRHHVHPRLDIIDVCSVAEADAVERQWILSTSESEPMLLNKAGNPQFVKVNRTRQVRITSITPGTMTDIIIRGRK